MAAQRRRVVLIMTDTQRTDMVGCYGNSEIRTPHLDRLGSQGVRFDRAYTCQPVCGPARSALFTGIYPHSNGSWGNSMPLGDNVKTVGQRLADSGVRCGYIGKWHLDGGDYFGLGRCPGGWDPAYWYDMRNYLDELTPDQRPASRRVETIYDPGIEEGFTYGHRVADRARRFLASGAGEDFFLVVSFDEPHHPFLCPEPYASMYKGCRFPRKRNVRDTLAGKPEHQRAWAGDNVTRDRDRVEIGSAAFFGCNSFVDYEIGRVLEAVDRHCPDALVIYTSDHGDALQSHSITSKGAAMYDEITRIPLIVRWPGGAPAGATAATPVSHIDLVPTVLERFGVPLPRLLEGEPLSGIIRDPSRTRSRDVFIEFGRYEIDHDGFGGFQPVRAIFDGRWKLVINLLSSDELYDLEADPEEIANLIESDACRAARDALHDRLLDWMNRARDPFRGYYWERRPWRKDARPATWKYTSKTRQRENEEYEPRQLDYDTGLPMTAAVRDK